MKTHATTSRRRQPHYPSTPLLLLLLLLLPLSSPAFLSSSPFPSHSPSSHHHHHHSATKKDNTGPSASSSSSSSPPTKKRPPSSPPPAPTKKKSASPSKAPSLGTSNAWSLSPNHSLPPLTTLHPPLPLEQLLAWERDGHTITRSLCQPEEIKDYSKVIRAAFEKEKLVAYRQKIKVMLGQEAYNDCRTLEECEEVMDEYIDPDSIPFLQTFNSWRKYQDVRRLALASRFAHVAAQLLNVPRVRLYQDSTFLKRCGDGPTLWHSDLNMAPFHCNEAVTMWMPMTEILPEEEGGTGLTFATKSHRDFALNFWMDPHAGEDLSGRYKLDSYGEMSPGDASWHHGWLLHSSAHNDGDDRLAFTLCFVADGVSLLSDEAKHRPDDEDDMSYSDWLKDFKPGQKIKDHPFLPLVYDADAATHGK